MHCSDTIIANFNEPHLLHSKMLPLSECVGNEMASWE